MKNTLVYLLTVFFISMLCGIPLSFIVPLSWWAIGLGLFGLKLAFNLMKNI